MRSKPNLILLTRITDNYSAAKLKYDRILKFYDRVTKLK